MSQPQAAIASDGVAGATSLPRHGRLDLDSSLSRLLGPIGLDSFLAEYFNKKGVHISGSMPDPQLFGWGQLNNILNNYPGLPPNAKILIDGKEIVPIDYLVALRDIRRGSTLFFEDIDRFDPVLSSFLRKLSQELQCSTRFNMYLSSPGKQGRRLHFDTHDVFIIQVEGSKRWTIYDITSQSPIYFRKNHDSELPEDAEPYLDCILKKGDVLYLPRGHWHNVVPCDEMSLHLTLGMFMPTGIDFLVWLADECTEIDVARENVPLRVCFPDDETYIAARRDHMARIVQAMVTRASSERIVEDYEAFSVASLPNRTPFNFPLSTARDEFMPSPDTPMTARGHAVRFSPSESHGTNIVYSNRVLSVPPAITAVAREMLDGRRFCLADVEARLSEESIPQLHSLLKKLLSEGLVTPVDGDR
jgi:ribosomal protein L16 Arg81 hydroxylase